MRRFSFVLLLLLLPMLAQAGEGKPSDFPTGQPLVLRRPANKQMVARLPPDTAIQWIVLKFHEGTHVRLRGRALAALVRDARENAQLAALGLTAAHVENDIRAVQALLAGSQQVRGLDRLFTISEEVLAARRASGEERSGHELADLDLYYRLQIPTGAKQADLDLLLETLNGFASIEIAYAQPPPSVGVDISPTTPNFQPNQGYLGSSPNGIDALYAWNVPGGRGASTKIVDVEGGWRTTHEDMPPLFHQSGTQINDLAWRNHGTAVLGVLVAPSNGYGVTGIVHQAQAGYESIGSQPTANAITNAAIAAGVSGLVLIELHALGPSTPSSPCNCSGGQCDFVPMEFWQAEFDAIANATNNGTIVVEAGGNGATNLDDPVYGGVFNRMIRDSGAILVGAGESYQRSPTCFTNFGSRIDMHGWGWNVTTLGYGGLFNPGDENQWYTSGFSGTSSASPIVTGAAASIIGVSLADGQGFGGRSPAEIRQILKDTGTSQAVDSRNIGPLPNLALAIPRILDRRPVASFTISCTTLTCSADATASSDDHGITGCNWNWGDGTSSTGCPTANHTYASASTYLVTLTVSDVQGQTNSTSRSVTVSSTPPTTPGNFLAAAATTTSVALSWTASSSSSGIAHYVIQRRSAHGFPWGPEQSTTATSFSDAGVSAGTTYQYRIKAVDNAGLSSGFASDYATTVLFGPDLQRFVTIVDGDHLRDLRDAVDAWRTFAGLAQVYPVNPVPTGNVKAANFITSIASDPLPGVVTALNQARSTMGLPEFVYSGAPAPAVGGIVYLDHIQQLRVVIQ